MKYSNTHRIKIEARHMMLDAIGRDPIDAVDLNGLRLALSIYEAMVKLETPDPAGSPVR